ncbi:MULTISPECIES: carbohydrate ABC transporter permease [Paenibacillus]|uniref:Binding-protein-dependent transport systems inner membrane component n=2 Tax=Paenibacillus lactis TaxID=228574 RepID=G4HI66_9BACL|nr:MULTISPECIES: carbohydrate ABC transporter permease [Paenibacillus]EHB63039.1 binding-protein-dependent transport systems inner membrane component [Paenibacillus lactis 154]MBP1894766.1 multiple sugar transport system permease protein [Paenibacillus lactis]MCM3495846.1 carbohydrate ABC transporter permease [Paenibacillus lactis]GIO92803.1 sugar ABC transporter permease [Paenibacillus lactis]HAG00231.1 carbohydrate ABC transporter permease [Paenibacillus lactis]
MNASILGRRLLTHLILILVGLMFLAPFAWLLLTTFKTEDEIFVIPVQWFPSEWIWDNYRNAVQMIPFIKYTWNTIVIALLSVAGVVILSPLVAYGFSRIDFKGRNVLFIIMLSTLMLPMQVTMIPLYVVFNKANLLNSNWPLVLSAWFGTGMAFNVFLIRQFFNGIPIELTESAKIDGASEFRIYSQIILPLAKPALLTIGLFTFLGAWGDFQGALIYLNDQETWTLSIGLKQFIRENSVAWGPLMAAATLFTVPIIILYFFVQKKFIEGITITGMK